MLILKHTAQNNKNSYHDNNNSTANFLEKKSQVAIIYVATNGSDILAGILVLDIGISKYF